MKDSKEKEHRISNLKDMIHNIKEDNVKESANYDDVEEDSELIDYLNDSDEFEELEIDDEFIYRPGDEPAHAINLEETPIDENFIINTPKEKDVENTEIEENPEDFMGEISENFDTIVNAKIGRTPVLGIVSTLIGLILIIISAFIFQSRSDRVIDHVVSGETNFIFVIVLAFGLIFFAYGIIKVFYIKLPFKGITDRINSIENDEEEKNTTTKKDEPEPQIIPNSEIPLDKESYKIGEFDIGDLKEKLKKPTASKKTKNNEENVEDLPPAKEKKELTAEEIEYEQVQLDNESIDEIFAEVEDIKDMPIISIDSEEKKEE
ncbi:topoisomerase IV [Methanobrevibacter sp.]|uniref:topoisomerase IV n=1 Tax=Methanobrevibacter sp. TaxID=66852 RepID=UPI00388D810B